MDKIQGNYLTQSNRDFPLDAETLDYIQTNAAMIAALGNIGGDKIILQGCELASGNRAEGYVYVKTAAAPQGEVLRFEGGADSAGMYVKAEAIAVNALGNSYPTAYSKRTLAAGTGSENFVWKDFVSISSNRSLMTEIEKLKADIALLSPAPLGIVQLWSGGVSASDIPKGYHLCDGAQLSATEYDKLFAAIGLAHTPASTDDGYFCLPDLRGKFIAGYGSNDFDYNTIAKKGGAKSVTLGISQMPSHVHRIKDYYYPENTNHNYPKDPISKQIGSGDTDGDNIYLLYNYHDTESAGGGQSHENRPPYYVLAYIMRLK